MSASWNLKRRSMQMPVFSDFTQVTDDARFKPLPDGWMVGVALKFVRA